MVERDYMGSIDKKFQIVYESMNILLVGCFVFGWDLDETVD